MRNLKTSRIDDNGLITRSEGGGGWSSDGVVDEDEPHPEAIATGDEIGQVLEYLATINLDLCYDLIIGIDAEQVVTANL